MSASQVLALHHVGGAAYELSGLRTGSVRDQILRACLLVEALLAEKEIAPGRHPLLVLGGGAAGVAAALCACAHGVDVTLIEQHGNPFHTQLGVTTRYLDPTEFDWPHPHWSAGDMSWAGSLYPLPYQSDFADVLAQHWTVLLRSLVDPAAPPPPPGFGILDIHYGVDARLLFIGLAGTGSTQLQVSPLQGGPLQFDAAISCIGFRGERTEVPSRTGGEYVGPKFWATDSLEQPYLGLRGTSDPVRVLVSGGGDGAQQDFLRCATGDFGARLLHRLDLEDLTPYAADLLGAQLAEDAARREHAWSQPGQKPARAYHAWNAAFEKLAEAIWRDWKGRRLVTKHAAVLRGDVVPTWVVGGASPEYCYGLNRLLVLLVVRLIAAATGRPRVCDGSVTAAPAGTEVMLLNFRLSEVDPVGHRCSGSLCWGKDHEVFVDGQSGQASLGTFQFVVVRHGVVQDPFFRSPPIKDQLVPMQRPR